MFYFEQIKSVSMASGLNGAENAYWNSFIADRVFEMAGRERRDKDEPDDTRLFYFSWFNLCISIFAIEHWTDMGLKPYLHQPLLLLDIRIGSTVKFGFLTNQIQPFTSNNI